MDITKEMTGDLTAAIKIHLQPEDYRGEVNKEINRYAREARMPGFRPGKVPKGLVKRMMGKSVVIEQVSKLVGAELNEYIQQEDLKILGEPIPTEKREEDYFDLDCKKELDFTFEVGLAPTFDLVLDNGSESDPLYLYDLEIDEEFLDKEIEANRDRYAEVENPEEVAEGDILYGMLAEKLPEESEEEGFKKMIVLSADRIEKPEIFEPFIGKALEHTTDFDIFQITEDSKELSDLLFLEEEEIELIKGKPLSFTLKRINRTTLAEMDEEFFQKVLTAIGHREETEEPITEEQFREALKGKIAEELETNVSQYFQHKARKHLLDANPVQMPDEFLLKWMKEANSRESELPDFDDAKWAEELASLKESLHWSLIMDKLQEAHPELEVTREELEASIVERVRAHTPDATPDMEREFLNYSLQNQEIMRMHLNRLIGDRLYVVLKEDLAPSTQSITATDFVELMNSESEAQ